jgi:hypothetical protein
MAICLFHPLYVIAARVHYSVHYPTQELRDGNKNIFKAIKNIKKTYGWKGFYKGFIPQSILTFAFFIPIYCFQVPPEFYGAKIE